MAMIAKGRHVANRATIAVRILEHDPEKWGQVFGKDHAPASKTHPALGALQPRGIKTVEAPKPRISRRKMTGKGPKIT